MDINELTKSSKTQYESDEGKKKSMSQEKKSIFTVAMRRGKNKQMKMTA